MLPFSISLEFLNVGVFLLACVREKWSNNHFWSTTVPPLCCYINNSCETLKTAIDWSSEALSPADDVWDEEKCLSLRWKIITPPSWDTSLSLSLYLCHLWGSITYCPPPPLHVTVALLRHSFTMLAFVNEWCVHWNKQTKKTHFIEFNAILMWIWFSKRNRKTQDYMASINFHTT